MPDASKYFAVRRYTVGTTFPGTAITAPVDCTFIVIEQSDTSNDAAFRSDPDDGATEKTIPAGMELSIRGSKGAFVAGSTVGYVKAASGSGPIVVSFAL